MNIKEVMNKLVDGIYESGGVFVGNTIFSLLGVVVKGSQQYTEVFFEEEDKFLKWLEENNYKFERKDNDIWVYIENICAGIRITKQKEGIVINSRESIGLLFEAVGLIKQEAYTEFERALYTEYERISEDNSTVDILDRLIMGNKNNPKIVN